MDPVVLVLRGPCPSKKNSYTPRKDGKGIYKSPALQAALDRLALQIPGSVRDLKLESPEIDFHFTHDRANWDRDNAVTTLIDLLVEYGVLVNDNIRRMNGKITIWPSHPGDYPEVTIVIVPRVAPEPSPRYRSKSRPRKIPQAVALMRDNIEEFEDYEDGNEAI